MDREGREWVEEGGGKGEGKGGGREEGGGGGKGGLSPWAGP